MTPTLSDEDLRRRLFAESALRLAPRPRMSLLERAFLTGCSIFFIAFFYGLVWHVLMFDP